jgi:FkbM family methyltransferase
MNQSILTWFSNIFKKLKSTENLQLSSDLHPRERSRLEKLPRNTKTSTIVYDHLIELSDPYWFLHTFDEIIHNEIYKFKVADNKPKIIDCGANIGLSIIYFKYLYPEARITGFEPDPDIFEMLKRNLQSCDHADINLYNCAVWSKNTTLSFQPDGSVGGRVVNDSSKKSVIKVEAVRLRDFLDEPLDFLKIDIEGSEYQVLRDCGDRLNNIQNLFVEYHGGVHDSHDLHDVLRIISSAGFRYHIKESWPINHPFIKDTRRSTYYSLLNIFAYRR